MSRKVDAKTLPSSIDTGESNSRQNEVAIGSKHEIANTKMGINIRVCKYSIKSQHHGGRSQTANIVTNTLEAEFLTVKRGHLA
jgi:hypothetical protein